MPAPKGNKNAKGNKGGGRSTSYKQEYAGIAYQMALLGATDAQLSDAFEVCETTINAWKKVHVEFCEALKKGKDQADAVVAHSLFKRATGYEHPEVDVKMFEGKIILTDLIKHYPPDTGACVFWLKNRQSAKWRDKIETGDGDDETPSPTRVVIEVKDARKPSE